MRPRAAHPSRGLPGPRLQKWTEAGRQNTHCGRLADHSDGQATGHTLHSVTTRGVSSPRIIQVRIIISTAPALVCVYNFNCNCSVPSGFPKPWARNCWLYFLFNVSYWFWEVVYGDPNLDYPWPHHIYAQKGSYLQGFSRFDIHTVSVRKSIELRLAYKLWGPLPENINCILQVRSYEPINLTDIFSKYKLAFSSKILSCKDHGQAQ